MLRTAIVCLLIGSPFSAAWPQDAKDEPEPTAVEPAKTSDDKPPATPEATSESPKQSPKPVTNELPWKKPTVRLPPSVKAVSTPRELLDLRGVKESEWDRTADGQPWGADDDELLLKVMLHFPRFSLVEVHRWQQPPGDWAKLLEQSAEKRGQIFSLSGVVKRIERRDLIEELVERYEYDHYYSLQFQPDGETRLSELFVRHIPTAWKVGEEVNYHLHSAALFLKRGGTEANETAAYFAGERCAWHPLEPVAEAGITAQHVLLSSRGFDVALLADLDQADGRPLDDFDREPMNQTLLAMNRFTPQDWQTAQPTKLELARLLAKPNDQHLRFVQVGGTARRIVKVLLEAEDRERLGFDHYYEIDFFIPLGSQVIKLGKDKEDAPTPEFRNDFPATLCVLELPPGLKEGEKMTQQISAEGVFYRIWSYRSQFMAKYHLTHQPAPLFISRTVQKIEAPTAALSKTDYWVIGSVIGSIAIFGVFLAFAGRKSSSADAALAKEIRKRPALPDKIAPPQDS